MASTAPAPNLTGSMRPPSRVPPGERREYVAKSSLVTPVGTSGSDYELSSQIRTLFMQARGHRRPLVQQWNRSYRILRNRTWSGQRANWLPAPEVPEIFPIVASIVGWMTDQRPTFDAIPSVPPGSPNADFYSRLAQDLKTVLQSVWQVQHYDAEVELGVWDSQVFGTAIFKSGWDDSLNSGIGDVTFRRIDPYTFYPDPQATSLRDANYFIEARTMSLQEMDRRWPGSADKFLNGQTDDVDVHPTMFDSQPNVPRANPGAISPNTSHSYGLPGQSRLSGQAFEDIGVTVFEAWLRQHHVDEVKGGPDDGEQTTVDTWRVVCVAGNCVLMDEMSADIFPWAGHPYDRFVPFEIGEFWGVSLVDLLTPTQLAINKLLASFQQNVELTGNPILKEDTRSGLTRQRIANRPGTRISMNPGGQAEWMAPPTTSQDFMSLIQWYIGEMERVSGLSAINRGIAPGGRNAASVIDSMQEASFVRVRMMLRNLEWAIKSNLEKLASLVVQNYTLPRMIAMMGPDGATSAQYLRGRHFYVPDRSSDDPTASAPLRFQLLVQAGSALPTSRASRAMEADTLFAMGALDVQAVLEAHDYPNRNLIAQRVMMAQQQQGLGMAPAPGARQRAGRTS